MNKILRHAWLALTQPFHLDLQSVESIGGMRLFIASGKIEENHLVDEIARYYEFFTGNVPLVRLLALVYTPDGNTEAMVRVNG